MQDQPVRAWLKKQGFQEGDLRSEANLDYYGMTTPMARACLMGKLHVCKWLHDHGAAADITSVDDEGNTPMYWACQHGHLPVCKWLYQLGAAADITNADNYGQTPMLIACAEGRLLVCEWLFEVGATADITEANNDGHTPMSYACQQGHLSVCKWLVFNGALNRPTPAGHVDQAIVERDIAHHRPALLAWAQGIVADHHAFRDAFLPGALSKQHCSAHLWMLIAQTFQELIVEFAWGRVENGQRLRNAREFAEALVALG